MTEDIKPKEIKPKEIKKAYVSPATVRLSGSDNEYGAAIAAGALWAIGIVFGWGWVAT